MLASDGRHASFIFQHCTYHPRAVRCMDENNEEGHK